MLLFLEESIVRNCLSLEAPIQHVLLVTQNLSLAAAIELLQYGDVQCEISFVSSKSFDTKKQMRRITAREDDQWKVTTNNSP